MFHANVSHAKLIGYSTQRDRDTELQRKTFCFVSNTLCTLCLHFVFIVVKKVER